MIFVNYAMLLAFLLWDFNMFYNSNNKSNMIEAS